MGYIYKTTNLINGKIYVGKSLYLPDGYLGSGLRLSGAIKKYGKNNFRREILEEWSRQNPNVVLLNCCDNGECSCKLNLKRAIDHGGISLNRIDFSNDTLTASPKGPLSTARTKVVATGNSNYGWFGGGNNPSAVGSPYLSIVDRINFSNDSATASVRGSLSAGRYYLAATSNTTR